MSYLCDLHAHTTYCDGSASPEEMILSAIAKGCRSFGLSAHAPVNIDGDWYMREEKIQPYLSELYSLKEKYADKIEFYVGFEADMYSPELPRCDYKIASLHYTDADGKFFDVDHTEEKQKKAVSTHFGGDFYAYVENYYDRLKSVIERTHGDIIGHFDLVTKFNGDGKLFNENDPRYLSAAFDAMSELVKYGLPFEINTGAISRGYRNTPYPSKTLLAELHRLGGRIMFCSDAHSPSAICCCFDSAKELAKECGFDSHVVLAKGNFTEVALK